MTRKGKMQFSVRALIGGITLIALLMGFIAYFRTEPYPIRRIRALGGEITSNYNADFAVWAEPCGFIRFRTVSAIDVESDELSNDDLQRLLSCAPRERISISSSQITDEGIAFVARMPDMSDVRLNCLNVSDEGLKVLTGLDRLYSLEIYGHSRVRGAFLEQFAIESELAESRGIRRDRQRRISSIILHGATIDDEACRWIARCG